MNKMATAVEIMSFVGHRLFSRRPLFTESAKTVANYLKVLLSKRLHVMGVEYSTSVWTKSLNSPMYGEYCSISADFNIHNFILSILTHVVSTATTISAREQMQHSHFPLPVILK